jgi:membrane-associated phospholipid phosphatase
VKRARSARAVAHMRWLRVWLALSALAWGSASAGGGLFGIDHEVALDDSGIWARKYQTGLQYGVVAVELGGALWFGNDDPLGHTFWQTVDASAVSGIAAQVMKRAFGRARPDQGNNPNRWFKGSCCESFPSGEVTLQASFVTPLIIDYYRDRPWVWALEALPVYDAIGRLKVHAHWQSDVIAGWLLGTGVGYWSTTRKVPLTVEILPRGLSIGISKRF